MAIGIRTFRFNESTCLNPEHWTDITIKVERVKEKDPEHEDYGNGKEYYNISYSYETCEKTKQECGCNMGHPLSEHDEMNHEGEIIVVNDMTKHMIKFLLMDIDELEKVTGHSCGITYKSSIMKSITLFWD